jgi:hypothetical protein
VNGWTPEELDKVAEINRMEWRAAAEPTLFKATELLQREQRWNFFYAHAVARAAAEPTLFKATELLQREQRWNFFYAHAVAQYIAWKYNRWNPEIPKACG